MFKPKPTLKNVYNLQMQKRGRLTIISLLLIPCLMFVVHIVTGNTLCVLFTAIWFYGVLYYFMRYYFIIYQKSLSKYYYIKDGKIDGIVTEQHPEYEDAYISEAYLIFENRYLTEEELNVLNEDGEYVQMLVHDHMVNLNGIY